MKGRWFLAVWCCWAGSSGAASLGDEVLEKSAQAKQEYEQGHFEEALQLYRQAQVEAPEARALNFNVGSTLFKTGDLAGAAKEFDAATAAADPQLRARSFYNLGNTHFQQQQYQQAVEAYKQALESDWQDEDAKANLELALRKQQEQAQEQEQQQGGDEKNQDRRQPQAGQQGQQQPQGQQEQEQQQQAGQGQQQRGQEQRPQEREQPEQGQGKQGRAGQRNRMDREEAEQLLDALRDREKEAHQRRQHPTKAYRGQDW